MSDIIAPLEVDELTAEWFSAALGARRSARRGARPPLGHDRAGARRAASGAPSLPATVFVKLPPFDAAQRVFVNNVGMGVTEARFFCDLAGEVGVRVPKTLFATYSDDDRYVMVFEDLEASRLPVPRRRTTPTSSSAPATSSSNSQCLHARYWESPRFEEGGDLAWIAPKATGRGDGGAQFVRMAIDGYADRLPDGFLPLAEFYVSARATSCGCTARDERTLVHGDPHLGNLFVDGERTGFLDWAVIARAPGLRDVAYVLCNSIPTEVRRAHERDLVAHYCELLGAAGIDLDFDTAWQQYRLFAVYSWVSATATLGMGSKWQPEHIGLGGTTRATHRRRRPRRARICWRHGSERSRSLPTRPSPRPKEPPMSLYDTPIATLDGKDGALAGQKGDVTLLVNVASFCGLTPQYTGLEALQQKYADKGFSVIGLPCNQFGAQEPGTPEEIATFCSTNYNVSFPLTEKIEVNGDGRHALYQELTQQPDAEGHTGDIRWNFEKFLVNRDGEVVARFSPVVEPEAAEITEAIEKELAAG